MKMKTSVKTLLGMGVSGFLVACAGGEPPVVSSAEVICTADGADYVWDFTAQVDDADGYEDVVSVSVDIYDIAVDAENPAGTADLAYLENGQWALSIGQSSASYLNCDNLLDYEFDFWATDSFGNDADGLTYVPAE
jgi:hypothetical protein